MRDLLPALAAACLAAVACSSEPETPPASAEAAGSSTPPSAAAPLPDGPFTVSMSLVTGLEAVERNPETMRHSLTAEPAEGLDASALPGEDWEFGEAPLTKTESVPYALSRDRREIWFDGDRDGILEASERREGGRRVGGLTWHEGLETWVRREHEGRMHEDGLAMAVGALERPTGPAFSRLDSHRAGSVELSGQRVLIAVVDRTFRGWFTHLGRDRLMVDVDGDGRFETGDDSHERYRLGEPVPIGERDYVVTAVDPLGRTLTFSPSEKPARRMARLAPGEPAPELAGPSLDGGELRLSAHRGSWVLIDFWATWCRPCLAELPHLKELVATHPDLVILGVSGDRSRQALESYLARDPLPWRQLFDEGAQLRREYRVSSLPTNYLIAPDGTIAAKNLRGARLLERFEAEVARWERARGPKGS